MLAVCECVCVCDDGARGWAKRRRDAPSETRMPVRCSPARAGFFAASLAHTGVPLSWVHPFVVRNTTLLYRSPDNNRLLRTLVFVFSVTFNRSSRVYPRIVYPRWGPWSIEVSNIVIRLNSNDSLPPSEKITLPREKFWRIKKKKLPSCTFLCGGRECPRLCHWTILIYR